MDKIHDKMAVLHVLGALIKKPELIMSEEYTLAVEDFPEQFHRVVYAAINNLVQQGVESINYITLDSFLSDYPKQHKVFCDNDGEKYIEDALALSQESNFAYYYNRVKKFSLLQALYMDGFDTHELYDADITDPREYDKMSKNFEEMTLDDMISWYEMKIAELKERYSKFDGQKGQKVGTRLTALKEKLKEEPEVGIPMQSPILNTIARGARLKKLYMRSGGSGSGKTRLMVGDGAMFSIPRYYDWDKEEWVSTGFSEPTLFITTELEIEEIQTQFLAYVSGVNEDKILDGFYSAEEEAIIDESIQLIADSPLWIEHVPNFNIETVKNTIKRYKLKHKIGYVCFDYIFMSPKMLYEISQKARGVSLRQDNILYIFADEMKSLCNNLNVHMSTASQLSGDYVNAKTLDHSFIRGSKAVADKLDLGLIATVPTLMDLEALDSILKQGFTKTPNLVYHIYKVRRGKITRVKLWLYSDLGTCRTTDLFVTDNDYNLVNVDSTNITKILDELSVELKEVKKEVVIDIEEAVPTDKGEFKF